MSSVVWLDSLSPWPKEGFGLERMRALLAELGDPQEAYPAIHVVGTNGKSTATITIEQLLLADGLSVGSTISPHVADWSERIRIDGVEADFEEAVAVVRPAAERVGATQFEIVTAAALAAFAHAGVDAAVVEAGLGGRLDATNVLRTRVVLLTNVGLDHTDVLGDTVEAIAREKLAVAKEGAIVVLPDDTYAHLVAGHELRIGGAREAAEAFVGHRIDAEPQVSLPGRLERKEGEVRDGAHNPDGVRFLVERLPPGDHTVVASILVDKDADEMLRELSSCGVALRGHEVVVSTCAPGRRPRRARASPFRARGGRGRPRGRAGAGPRARGARARDRLAVPARRPRPGREATCVARVGERLSVLAFAALLVLAIVALAFGLGYLVGKLLL